MSESLIKDSQERSNVLATFEKSQIQSLDPSPEQLKKIKVMKNTVSKSMDKVLGKGL